MTSWGSHHCQPGAQNPGGEGGVVQGEAGAAGRPPVPVQRGPPRWPRGGAFTHRISFLSLGSRSSRRPRGSHVPLRGGNQRQALGRVLRPTSPTPASRGPPCPSFLAAADFVIANCTMTPSLPPPEREGASESFSQTPKSRNEGHLEKASG